MFMPTDDRICINVFGRYAADFAEKSTPRYRINAPLNSLYLYHISL